MELKNSYGLATVMTLECSTFCTCLDDAGVNKPIILPVTGALGYIKRSSDRSPPVVWVNALYDLHTTIKLSNDEVLRTMPVVKQLKTISLNRYLDFFFKPHCSKDADT